jgi:hypothetical protein
MRAGFLAMVWKENAAGSLGAAKLSMGKWIRGVLMCRLQYSLGKKESCSPAK